ncbi:type II toxin-antitoxin system PemK/MazF family toxin [Deinococcus sp.]|uniref:type II toxin-antitoxin system PemK/MazF family toxin n=1 Tax=Deinococcus sp. TaxID=47478 RepID=UPI0025F00F83|nr:type II toxin-antitoxin system PemK/MazF family toxin [Deinococcus sp.]
MKRGEVWQANLDPRSGSEQQGNRPVLVLSSDIFNNSPGWKSFVVIPFSTSGRQAARGPTAVPLAAGAGGLARESYALCHQITTLDRTKFVARLGALDATDIQAIERGVVAALDMLNVLKGMS